MKELIFRFLLLFLTIMILSALSSCYVGRYFYWNYADINDYRKFPDVPVQKGQYSFHFIEGDQHFRPVLPEGLKNDIDPTSFDGFLQDHQTVAFLIIRNDSILYEKYFAGFDDTAIIPSFSISKSFLSALTGIAIHEGFIKSVGQPITDFIPELLKCDIRFGSITIDNLLNMRTGIRFKEKYTTPFSKMAKFYYGTDLTKYVLKLEIDSPPGLRYDYISANSQLLGMVIERATQKPLNQYLEEKIWIPLGMEFDASWSIDSHKHHQIKSFCCLNARTRDFAKLGRLYLKNGNWDGRQVVPGDWITLSMSIVNDSRDSQGYPYTWHWRVKNDGAIFAKGVLGQYIYIFPEKQVIIVRLGKRSTDLNWVDFFEQLCSEL